MGRSKLAACIAATTAFLLLALLPADRGAVPDSIPQASHSSGRIGVYLTSYALGKEEVVRGVLTARAAGKIDTLVINVKNNLGEVTYDSHVPLAVQIGASTGRLDLKELLPILHAQGFYLIARQVVFNDPVLAHHLGIDGDWVPANDPTAVAYNLAIAQEVASLGFDELQFDYIRYADGGGLTATYEERYTAIDAFLSQARALIAGRIPLSADLFGRVLWAWNMKRIDPIGQCLEDMSEYLDYVSPMLYPSHYTEQAYKDDPYLTVHDALISGAARVDTPIRPFLQAFDRYIPTGMSLETYIAEQIRAALECGADGYLFWNPSCDYAALYRVLGVE
jgi:hypothetical protein